MSAVAEELARFGSSARSAAAEADRLERQREAAELARDQHRSSLSDLENRLYAVESEDAPEEVDPAERDALAERTALARQREVEARLVQRTAEERARATAGTAESLRRSARQERQHRIRVAAAEAGARPVRQSPPGWSRSAGGSQTGSSVSLAEAAAERDRATAAARRSGSRTHRCPGQGVRTAGAVGPVDRRGALRRGAACPADRCTPNNWPPERSRSSRSRPTN